MPDKNTDNLEVSVSPSTVAPADSRASDDSRPRWRVGRKVPINVYDGDRPVCQCQTAIDAREIVRAVNGVERLQEALLNAEDQIEELIGENPRVLEAEVERLRAAQADLLEALKIRGSEIEDGTLCFCGLYGLAGEHTNSCEKARAAIAKAEGTDVALERKP